MKNHHVFNLGGDYNVEMIWMPGHAQGHCMVLDQKRRRLFAGDDVCSDVINCGSGGKNPHVIDDEARFCTIEAYRNELVKLCERLDEFDYIFPGHFMVYLENSLLKDILAALDEILDNPGCYDDKVEQTGRDGSLRTTWYKYVKGFGAISYNKDRGVYIPKE